MLHWGASRICRLESHKHSFTDILRIPLGHPIQVFPLRLLKPREQITVLWLLTSLSFMEAITSETASEDPYFYSDIRQAPLGPPNKVPSDICRA